MIFFRPFPSLVLLESNGCHWLPPSSTKKRMFTSKHEVNLPRDDRSEYTYTFAIKLSNEKSSNWFCSRIFTARDLHWSRMFQRFSRISCSFSYLQMIMIFLWFSWFSHVLVMFPSCSVLQHISTPSRWQLQPEPHFSSASTAAESTAAVGRAVRAVEVSSVLRSWLRTECGKEPGDVSLVGSRVAG